jgi:hypothetical protein
MRSQRCLGSFAVSSDDGKKFQGGRAKRPRLRRAGTNKRAFRRRPGGPELARSLDIKLNERIRLQLHPRKAASGAHFAALHKGSIKALVVVGICDFGEVLGRREASASSQPVVPGTGLFRAPGSLVSKIHSGGLQPSPLQRLSPCSIARIEPTTGPGQESKTIGPEIEARTAEKNALLE